MNYSVGNGTSHSGVQLGEQLVKIFLWNTMMPLSLGAATTTSIIGLALFLGYYIVTFWPSSKHPTMDVPLVNPPKDKPYDFSSLLLRGYFDNRNQPYKIAGPKSDLILLPARYATELGNYGHAKLSFGAAIHDFWQSKYTTWRYLLDDETGRRTLTGSLKRDGAHIVKVVDEEITTALAEWKGVGDSWQEIPINPSFRPLVNRAFGRVLVGVPLCRDQAWLDAANGLGIKMMLAARDLRNITSWARPIVSRFLPTYRALLAARRTLAKRIDPLVQSRLGPGKELETEVHDMIGYQLKHSTGWRAQDVDFQTGQIFDNVFAGDNQIVNALMQCIYDMAVHPECQPLMREEIREVVGKDGSLTFNNLSRLPKVDSFMKEVVRLRPGTLVVMARKALQEVQLSDGLIIPQGVTVAMPSFALNQDPEIYGDDAAEFKPFRFAGKGETTPASLAFESTLGPGLDFGYGRASCPGRHLALWTMKVVLARFILGYEVKLEPGVKRPANIDAGVHKIANMEGKILCKRID